MKQETPACPSHYRGLRPPLEIHHVKNREGRAQLIHSDHILEAQSRGRSGKQRWTVPGGLCL